MSNTTYHVYIGTSSEPVGCGTTKEEAIADALRELDYAGCIGDGHGGMVSTEDATRAALDVVHLWDAPDVVVKYLRTGDEQIRDAAWDAARNAAWDAARAAARDKQNRRLVAMLAPLWRDEG